MVLNGEDDGIAAGGPRIRTSQEFSPHLNLGATFLSLFLTHYNDVTAVVSPHCFIISVSVSLSSSSHHTTASPRQLSKGNAVACTHGDSLRRDEGMFFDGGQNITKLDFCGEGVSMVDDWHSVWTIPAVHWK